MPLYRVMVAVVPGADNRQPDQRFGMMLNGSNTRRRLAARFGPPWEIFRAAMLPCWHKLATGALQRTSM